MNWKKNQVELKYYAHNSNLKLWEARLELQAYRSDWRTLLKLGHCSAYILSESTKNERESKVIRRDSEIKENRLVH